jgi:hypothetical protein
MTSLIGKEINEDRFEKSPTNRDSSQYSISVQKTFSLTRFWIILSSPENLVILGVLEFLDFLHYPNSSSFKNPGLSFIHDSN